jgi:CrcB protein
VRWTLVVKMGMLRLRFMQVLKECLAIGVAGFLGALARFFVATRVQRLFETNFPIGTLVVNLSGCFVLGFFLKWAEGRMISDATRLGIGVGFVGAYTTFSTLMYDSDSLLSGGQVYKSVMNIVLSLALGLLAVRFGVICAKRF